MHDQNFKNLILDYPVEALQFFAQAESGKDLSKAKIIPIRQEQLKERLGNRFRELDVPLLVEWPDGEREALLFVLEEETQSSRFSIHRLAHYCLDIAEMMKTERVVPVVIFLNTGPRQEKLQLGGDRYTYLQFHYLYCDLKHLPAEDYYNSKNIVARLNLPNMHYAAKERLQIYAAAQTGLVENEKNPEKVRKYAEFIDYYADLSEQEIIKFQEQYIEKGENMGLTQILIQKGLEEGIEKGREEGREEGLEEGREEGLEQGLEKGRRQESIALLTRLLRRKFGLQPALEPILQQLNALPVADLEDLAEALFDLTTTADIAAWLQGKDAN